MGLESFFFSISVGCKSTCLTSLQDFCVFEYIIVRHCTPFVVILRRKKVNKINGLLFKLLIYFPMMSKMLCAAFVLKEGGLPWVCKFLVRSIFWRPWWYRQFLNTLCVIDNFFANIAKRPSLMDSRCSESILCYSFRNTPPIDI